MMVGLLMMLAVVVLVVRGGGWWRPGDTLSCPSRMTTALVHCNTIGSTFTLIRRHTLLLLLLIVVYQFDQLSQTLITTTRMHPEPFLQLQR